MSNLMQAGQFISNPLAIALLSFIFVRLLWHRRKCKRFHIFIAIGCACDIGRILWFSRSVFLSGETEGKWRTDYIRVMIVADTCYQLVVWMTWFCHIATAISWKELLIKPTPIHRFIKYSIYATYGFVVLQLSFNLIYTFINLQEVITSPLYVVIYNIWITIVVILNWFTIGYCLFQVLTIPINKFSKTTVKGYRKVALGLGIKTVLVSFVYICELLLVIFNLVEDAEKGNFVINMYRSTYGWNCVAQSITILWMLSGLLLNFIFCRQTHVFVVTNTSRVFQTSR